MRLCDVMTTFVHTARPEEPAEVAWNRMQLQQIHHLAVVDRQGRLVGVLSDRDLGGPHGAPVRAGRRVLDLMSCRPVTAPPDEKVRAVANLFRGRRISCLPVVEDGHLRGIVTVTDLLDLIGRGAERPIARGKRWTLRHRGRRDSAPARVGRAAAAGRRTA
jgi:acetoin utilization protein AcuB